MDGDSQLQNKLKFDKATTERKNNTSLKRGVSFLRVANGN